MYSSSLKIVSNHLKHENIKRKETDKSSNCRKRNDLTLRIYIKKYLLNKEDNGFNVNNFHIFKIYKMFKKIIPAIINVLFRHEILVAFITYI